MYSFSAITRTVTTRVVRAVEAFKVSRVYFMSETDIWGLFMRRGEMRGAVRLGLAERGGVGGGRDWRASRFSFTRVEAVRLRPPRREEDDVGGDGLGELVFG